MNAHARRRYVDGAARWVITLGGILIIASILAMLVFLVVETLPLWGHARVHSPDARSCSLVGGPGPAPILATNEYREILFAVTATGNAQACRISDGASLFGAELAGLEGRRISASSPLDPGARDWIAGTDDGYVVRIRLADGVAFTAGTRRYSPEITSDQPIALRPGFPVSAVAVSGGDDGFTVVAAFEDDTLRVVRRKERRTVLGAVRADERTWSIPLPVRIAPSALALDSGARHLFVGTSEGQIIEWDLLPDAEAPLGSYQVFRSAAVSALGMLLGGQSLVVGGANGEVEVWFRARTGEDGQEIRLVRAHRFDPHGAAVAGVAPSNRDKGFITWDAGGQMALRYSTTSETRLRHQLSSPAPISLVMAPKADGFVVSGADGRLLSVPFDNPHPEVSMRALFGKVQYEGYAEPDYVWQSTGATDETEPKLSLVPLIFGTLKGTFYALIVSIPVAILAALYTALFMRPRLRSVVKPAMELMAAMPSVVLGLLAALWLAPRLQNAMPVAFLVPVVLPAVVFSLGLLWRRAPIGIRSRIRPGTEGIVTIPILVVALALVLSANSPIDGLFDGGFLDWLYRNFGLRYDQRNALIVGLAMGLAVIPIIFSISEDALSSVPRHLTAGSLAIGATPWQTAWRVVLPAASPGIFSAVMIGFGRAVGETMIVLMATGNTPIMDWSMFNGFRTLSANIAVEIPEAPEGGTLYRILFLAALLLFAITFVVNTAADLVRQRLRQRYSRF